MTTVHRHILIYTNFLHCIVISSAFCQLPVSSESETHRNTALWGNEISPTTPSSTHAHISKATDVKFGVRDRETPFPCQIV